MFVQPHALSGSVIEQFVCRIIYDDKSRFEIVLLYRYVIITLIGILQFATTTTAYISLHHVYVFTAFRCKSLLRTINQHLVHNVV